MLSGDELESGDQATTQVVSGASNNDGNVVVLGRSEQAEIGRKLRELYNELAAEPLSEDVADAMAELEKMLREIDND